jgi:hypothetical protein
MADLLASLEVGITRTVGAASRLRNQITSIDQYMAAQRLQELAATYPSISNPTSVPHPSLQPRSDPNPNIDPNLQNTGQYQQNPYDYTNPANGVNTMSGPIEEQFLFQLPPELLADWPWSFDMSQGFGGIGGTQ